MSEAPDARLLEQFARNGSEEAFAELVRRHIGLVHSVALRRMANPQQAEDITQAVFVLLARKAGALGRRAVLPGWLYHTARLTAANWQRAEIRRVRREQEAFMQSKLEESTMDALWRELAPQLDEAMAGLGTSERDALVLRYFQNKSMAEVGSLLGLAENTAQKRVGRALEKLRKFFVKRGVDSTAVSIADTLSTHSIQAVPAALIKTVTAVALAKGATASISTLTLIKGALKIMAWTKAKTAIIAGAGALLIIGTTTVAVKKVEAYKTYRDSWLTLNLNSAVVDQSLPQVRILPTKFSKNTNLSENNAATKWAGLDMPVSVMMWVAYQWSPARVVFTAPEPPGRYDFITSLPKGPYEALQRELKNHFGLVGRLETRDVNALVLKVKTPNASGLKPPIVGSQNDWSGTGEYVGDDRPLSNDNPPFLGLQRFLEGYFNMPVVDETGLTNHYSIDLKWNERGRRDPGNQAIKQALLDQLGLELVPANRPLEMLVVEKAK